MLSRKGKNLDSHKIKHESDQMIKQNKIQINKFSSSLEKSQNILSIEKYKFFSDKKNCD